jgi:hypothetical protein
VPLWLRGVLMGFGGGVMLSALTISLFGEWLSRPDDFGRGSTSVLLVSALVGTITAHTAHTAHRTPHTRHNTTHDTTHTARHRC